MEMQAQRSANFMPIAVPDFCGLTFPLNSKSCLQEKVLSLALYLQEVP